MREKNSDFVLDLFEPKILNRTNVDGKRLYVTESGDMYPSVTTALSYFSRKSIAQWRARVGEAEANRISTRASTAGTAVHNIAEKYMLNILDEENINPIAWSTFKTIKPYLDENVTYVRGVELQMYSDELKTAGTADLICEYSGKKTILDFKTSRRPKKLEDITTYFMQGAAYAVMAKEHYGFEVEQIVILMAVHGGNPIVFIQPAEKYIPMTKKFFGLYSKGNFSY